MCSLYLPCCNYTDTLTGAKMLLFSHRPWQRLGSNFGLQCEDGRKLVWAPWLLLAQKESSCFWNTGHMRAWFERFLNVNRSFESGQHALAETNYTLSREPSASVLWGAKFRRVCAFFQHFLALISFSLLHFDEYDAGDAGFASPASPVTSPASLVTPLLVSLDAGHLLNNEQGLLRDRAVRG